MKKSKLFAVALVLSFAVMAVTLQSRESFRTHGSTIARLVAGPDVSGEIFLCSVQK